MLDTAPFAAARRAFVEGLRFARRLARQTERRLRYRRLGWV